MKSIDINELLKPMHEHFRKEIDSTKNVASRHSMDFVRSGKQEDKRLAEVYLARCETLETSYKWCYQNLPYIIKKAEELAMEDKVNDETTETTN